MMDDPYDSFRAELRNAGFYAPSTESMGTWNRIVPCSEGPPDMARFGGRSFWCALVEDIWYVGAWGSNVYRFPIAEDLIVFAQRFLADSSHTADFSPELKQDFGLEPIPPQQIRRLLRDGRPGHDQIQ